MDESEAPASARLLVCVRCIGSADQANPRPGRQLFERLQQELSPLLRVQEAECLSNCKRGCTVALRGPKRWTFVYGDIVPDVHLSDLIDGARRYASADAGLVPWKERPEHFRKHCIARLPPEEYEYD